MDCGDIVLFWRIQQMLKVTANALRQQVRAVTQNKVFSVVRPYTPLLPTLFAINATFFLYLFNLWKCP